MSSKETSVSVLDRLHADVERMAGVLAVGTQALPPLAMGSDPEGLVHIGIDARADVVRLDLEPGWRDCLPLSGLGDAVTEALQQAGQVRLGDWATGVMAGRSARSGNAAGPPERPAASTRTPQPAQVGGVLVHHDALGTRVVVDPVWAGLQNDGRLRSALIQGLSAAAQAGPEDAVGADRLSDVRALQGRARATVWHGTLALPAFMRQPLQDVIDHVHDGATQALALPLAGEAAAAPALRGYAGELRRCLRLAARPAGLPEASQAWAEGAIGLTAGLATTRRPRSPVIDRLRRRTRTA